jgi:hypothetical protein
MTVRLHFVHPADPGGATGSETDRCARSRPPGTSPETSPKRRPPLRRARPPAAAASPPSAGPTPPQSPPAPTGTRLYWWHEALFIAIFYGIYSAVRNQFGSAAVSPERALDNALRLIDAQKAMGLFFEERVQAFFLDWTLFIRFWNVFYGSFHFVVTLGALAYLFLRQPHRYPTWRNTLAATTGLALIGFAAFPLMPPLVAC